MSDNYALKTWLDDTGRHVGEVVSYSDGCDDLSLQEVVDALNQQQDEIDRLKNENNDIAQQLILTEKQKHNLIKKIDALTIDTYE